MIIKGSVAAGLSNRPVAPVKNPLSQLPSADNGNDIMIMEGSFSDD
jgi:hypothetical protein